MANLKDCTAAIAPLGIGKTWEAMLANSRLRLRMTRLMAVLILATLSLGATYWMVSHPIVEKSLYTLGIALAGMGAAGRAWATSYIAGQKKRRLVTCGPYSVCRNPLYFFSLVLGIGLGFCTETFTMPIVIAGVLANLYYVQIKQEEKALLKMFGAEYETYMATVPRFVPSLQGYTEPEEICVAPRLLRRGFFGIGFLLILIGAIELIRSLHEAGVLPVLFRVY